MAELSVIIITKNEAQNIRRCLESIKWANEIIIVDSGSDDDTIAICREYTNNIIETDWVGYGKQKNRALSFATKDWVLSLDADEQVSAALKVSIEAILVSPEKFVAYTIKRPIVFLGKIIKYACGADHTVRLFKRGQARFTDDIVHETIKVDGKIGKLNSPIFHYSFADVATVIEKMNKYTSLVATQRAAAGKKSSIFKAITHAIWMFIKVYLLKAGFLDGRAGFILSVTFAEGAYYRYIKLLTLEKNG